jgi:hypothetical protein
MSSYHAPEAMLAEDVLAQLGEGRPGGRVDELTRRFVVMGLPEQYSRVDGRPWTMHAHRALAYALNRRALRA